jgi:phosphonate transport system substrate-binding protein
VEPVDYNINIQLVPSFTVDSSALSRIAKIQAALNAAMPEEYNISVSIGTSYGAVLEAMAAGTCDVGFLTGQQYAYASVEMPGEVDVILTALRTAYKVQVDFPNDLDAQVAAMNGADDYVYRGEQSTSLVDYYTAILMTKADSGITSLDDLKGKTVGVGGKTSGSGYIYPSITMADAGLTLISEGTPNAAANEVKLQTVTGSHPGAFTAVMNGDVDAAWAYLDVRYTNFYNKTDSAFYQNAAVFTDYRIVAQSRPLYNDTVSVRANLDTVTRNLLAAAFKTLPDTADGLDGISVYSHLGYQDALDADYAGEREVYVYTRDVING